VSASVCPEMLGAIESASARCTAVLRRIGSVTGVALTEPQYKLYLGFFKDTVRRKLL